MSLIPKICYQTWKDYNIPERWKNTIPQFKKFHPSWEHRFMTDADNVKFVEKNFPQYFDVYRKLRYNIQRVDMIRYMWLYHSGGIYLDMDMEPSRAFDSMFKNGNDLYLIQSPYFAKYSNDFLASVKGHPFWIDCLEEIKNYRSYSLYTREMVILDTTGPWMIDRVFSRGKHFATIIPKNYFFPCDICGCNKSQVTPYVKKLEGNSWVSHSTWLPFLLYCYLYYIIILLVVIVVIIIVYLYMSRGR